MRIQSAIQLFAAIGISLPSAIAATLPPGFGKSFVDAPSTSPDLVNPANVFKRGSHSVCYDVRIGPITQAYDAPADAADCSTMEELIGHLPVFLYGPRTDFYGTKFLRYNTCAIMIWADYDYYTIGTDDVQAFIRTARDSLTTSAGLLGAEGHLTCTNTAGDNMPRYITLKIVRFDGERTNMIES